MTTRLETPGPASPVMQLLAAGLPLTLLVDLALGDRVRSQEVYATEPPQRAWVPVPGAREGS